MNRAWSENGGEGVRADSELPTSKSGCAHNVRQKAAKCNGALYVGLYATRPR